MKCWGYRSPSKGGSNSRRKETRQKVEILPKASGKWTEGASWKETYLVLSSFRTLLFQLDPHLNKKPPEGGYEIQKRLDGYHKMTVLSF
jgi:hypothetical protein